MRNIWRALLCGFLATTTLLWACKKGDNQKLEGPNESIAELMSANEGSYWVYGSNEGSVTVRYSTGRDTVMLDNSYDYYEKTDTTTGFVTPEFFGKNGDYFLMLVDMDGSMTDYMNVIVNKSGAKAGDTWTNTADKTYASIPFKLKTEGKIISTGGTYTINGTTYNHVTVAENKLGVKVTGQPVYTNCGSIKMWFAAGVGNIKSEFDLNIKVLTISLYSRYYTDSLLEYHIVP